MKKQSWHILLYAQHITAINKNIKFEPFEISSPLQRPSCLVAKVHNQRMPPCFLRTTEVNFANEHHNFFFPTREARR